MTALEQKIAKINWNGLPQKQKEIFTLLLAEIGTLKERITVLEEA